MDISSLVSQLGALAGGLDKATSVRDRVRASNAIYDKLAEIEGELERFVVSSIGKSNSNGHRSKPDSEDSDFVVAEIPGRFTTDVTIAEATRTLLKERGPLHGLEIERLLKEGGFPTKAAKFQPILRATLNRVDWFEFLGKNRWKIKDSAKGSAD